MQGFGYRTAKIQISVNVYDLMPGNEKLRWAGIGAFHSGLEISDWEYSFGGHKNNSTGVFK